MDRLMKMMEERKEARKDLKPDERQALALEQIADSLLLIQSAVAGIAARDQLRKP